MHAKREAERELVLGQKYYALLNLLESDFDDTPESLKKVDVAWKNALKVADRTKNADWKSQLN